jgi:cell division protein FtsW
MKRIGEWWDGIKINGIGGGYQVEQSVIGMGNGGLLGTGYGNGVQKYQWLPEIHTDFIFASIGEELGFIGLFLIIIAFIIIFVAGINFVMKKKNEFGKLVAFGIVIMITVQALINMYVATGLFPTKGMPLPFISFGGSAIIGIMVSCGVLLNIIKEDETE